MQMTVLGLQTDIAWEDCRANFSRIEEMLSSADPIPESALLVFPELATSGFSMNVPAIAESRDGESPRFFSGLARRYRCHVLAGIAGKHETAGLGANEAVCFAPDGGEAARYRKRYPFPLVNEQEHYPGGCQAVLFQAGAWKIAPLICYDLRFPEAFREAAALGAEVFVVIANWPAKRQDHWRILLRARAVENQAYVVGVNRCGSDPTLDYAGGSLIIGPRGEILAEAGACPGIIRAALDRDTLLDWRRDFPALTSVRLPADWHRVE